MNLTQIGYISKTHGLKGHCVLRINNDLFIDEEKTKAVFIDMNGSSAPYFVEELSWNNTGYLLKLEGIDSVEVAKRLVGKTCSVSADVVSTDDESDQQYVGYTVVDADHGELGPIEEIIDNTANVLMRITYKNKELLLPLADDLVDEVDVTNKKISYHAPPGLIDLFTS